MLWPQIDGVNKSVMTVLYVGTKKNVVLAVGAVVTIFTAGLFTGHFGINSSGGLEGDGGGEGGNIRRDEVERRIQEALREVLLLLLPLL